MPLRRKHLPKETSPPTIRNTLPWAKLNQAGAELCRAGTHHPWRKDAGWSGSLVTQVMGTSSLQRCPGGEKQRQGKQSAEAKEERSPGGKDCWVGKVFQVGLKKSTL